VRHLVVVICFAVSEAVRAAGLLDLERTVSFGWHEGRGECEQAQAMSYEGWRGGPSAEA